MGPHLFQGPGRYFLGLWLLLATGLQDGHDGVGDVCLLGEEQIGGSMECPHPRPLVDASELLRQCRAPLCPPPSSPPGLNPWGHPSHTLGYLVGGEGSDVGQQGLPELWALVKDGTQLLGWQLQDDLETLGLGALTALDEALPHLGILPHLDGAGRERS